MKPRLLELLVCPECGSPLACEVREEHEGEIATGNLVCSPCRASYPILRGVPRFVPAGLLPAQRETASAFGWEWERFTELDAPEEEQFLDWIHPVERAFFQGKTVLDAGCGMGRWTAQASRFGAAEVVGIDISSAVEAAQRRAARTPNMHVVQADLHRLPFGRAFDFAYSIGVLHHLPDPEAGFKAMVRHTAPGGAIHAWVYGRENNEWLVRVGSPIRRTITSRLPKPVLFGFSLGVAAALHPALKLLYGTAGNGEAKPSGFSSRLPYSSYLRWLAKFSLRHNHHVVFDHLVAPTAFYIRREEFRAWFERAGLKKVQLSWRNENSWRGYGEL